MEALEIHFGEVAEKDALFSELFSTTRGEKEALIEFAGRLQSICYRIQQTAKDEFDDMDEFPCHNFFIEAYMMIGYEEPYGHSWSGCIFSMICSKGLNDLKQIL